MPIIVSPTVSMQQGNGSPGDSLQPLTITLGDLTLGATDNYGVKWSVTALKGWFEQPTTTNAPEQRSADHGGWLNPAYYVPRVVEVEGYLEAVDWVQARQAFVRLSNAIPVNSLDTLTVYDGVTALQADVRQNGDVLSDEGDGVGVVTFSLSLVAPDPRRYSTDTTTASTGLPQSSGGLSTPLTTPLTVAQSVTAGVLSVSNAGNFPTRPTLTIDGPCPAFSITHQQTGKTLRSANAVPAGRTVTLDTDKRRATLDDGSLWLVTGSWFEYAPGQNDVAFGAATFDSGALLTSSHRSAWR